MATNVFVSARVWVVDHHWGLNHVIKVNSQVLTSHMTVSPEKADTKT